MDYYELRTQIRKGIIALLGIQPNRVVKDDEGILTVDEIRVPLNFDQWGYRGIVAMRIGHSRRTGVLRSKKDGTFPYSQVVTNILAYVDAEKVQEEIRKREREHYDKSKEIADRLGGRNHFADYSVSAFYNGAGNLEVNCSPEQWSDLEALVALVKMIRQPNEVSPNELDKLLSILVKYQESMEKEEVVDGNQF